MQGGIHDEETKAAANTASDEGGVTRATSTGYSAVNRGGSVQDENRGRQRRRRNSRAARRNNSRATSAVWVAVRAIGIQEDGATIKSSNGHEFSARAMTPADGNETTTTTAITIRARPETSNFTGTKIESRNRRRGRRNCEPQGDGDDENPDQGDGSTR